MESETKFVPQWLQARQQNDSNNGPLLGGDRLFMGMGSNSSLLKERDNLLKLGGNGAKNSSFMKYQLAEHRYGREEMLALFDPSDVAPDDLREHSIFVNESMTPVSLLPMADEEQNVNSSKSFQRGGGPIRGSGRGEYIERGRGRGRGRDDDGRLRGREPWDDRSSRSYDYSGQGFEDGLTSPHRGDFLSSTSHHTPFSKPSYDSWRTRGHQNDFESPDYGRSNRDKWGPRNWREPRIEGRQEESGFFKGTPSRDYKPVDLKRSKSLYEEEEHRHSKTVPEWSTADEDLGSEGCFDSSGAYLTSKHSGERRPEISDQSSHKGSKTEPESTAPRSPSGNNRGLKDHVKPAEKSHSTSNNANRESISIVQRSVSLEDGSSRLSSTIQPQVTDPPIISSSSAAVATSALNPVVSATTPKKIPDVAIKNKQETDEPLNLKIEQVIEKNDQLLGNNANVSSMSTSQQVSRPAEESNFLKIFSPQVNKQVFNYVKNCWYYKDPQGIIQGPFCDGEMHDWFSNGYFEMSLLLRAGEEGEFITLGAFAAKVGHIPFSSVQPPALIQQQMNLQHVVPTEAILSPRTPQPMLNNSLVHQMGSIHQEAANRQLFYSQQPVLQKNESLMSFFRPPAAAPEPTVDYYAAASTMHAPVLSDVSSGMLAWNQNSRILASSSSEKHLVLNKPTVDVGFPRCLPQSTESIWNTGIIAPNSNFIGKGDVLADHSQPSTLAHNLSMKQNFDQMCQSNQVINYASTQLEWERIEAEKKMLAEERERRRREELQMLEEMKRLEEQAKLEEMRRLEEVRIQEEKLERLRLEEEAQRKEAELLRERLKKQEEIIRETKRREEEEAKLREEMRQQEENKRHKEMKKRKDVTKEEQQRRAEQSRLQEEQLRCQEVERRKMEEQRKAEEELRRKQEEFENEFNDNGDYNNDDDDAGGWEEVRKKKESDDDMKHPPVAPVPTKNAWSTSLLAPSVSKSEVLKLTDIQTIEAAKQMQLRQQQIAEQKLLLAEMQKQQREAAKLSTIWKAPVTKVAAPKSLLDIQLEQASQQDEVVVKLPVQAPVKTNDIPFGSSWMYTKDTVTRHPESTAKDAVWEASVVKKPQKPAGVLDTNQFPALLNPKASGKKTSPRAPGRVGKEQAVVQKVFESKKVKDELTEWCEVALYGVKTEIDIPTLVDLLKDLDSPTEVTEFIYSYLGDTKQVKEFARQFVDRRHSFSVVKTKTKVWENNCNVAGRQQQSGAKTNESAAKNNEKSGKKGKKKMQKVDGNFLLGFTVHADPGRTNVGEIETLASAAAKK